MLTAYRPEELKKTKLLGIQITQGQSQRFELLASERGMTKSALGRWLIEQWMAEQDATDNYAAK